MASTLVFQDFLTTMHAVDLDFRSLAGPNMFTELNGLNQPRTLVAGHIPFRTSLCDVSLQVHSVDKHLTQRTLHLPVRAHVLLVSWSITKGNVVFTSVTSYQTFHAVAPLVSLEDVTFYDHRTVWAIHVVFRTGPILVDIQGAPNYIIVAKGAFHYSFLTKVLVVSVQIISGHIV